MELATLLAVVLDEGEERFLATVCFYGVDFSSLPLSPHLRERLGRAWSELQKLPQAWQVELSARVLKRGGDETVAA